MIDDCNVNVLFDDKAVNAIASKSSKSNAKIISSYISNLLAPLHLSGGLGLGHLGDIPTTFCPYNKMNFGIPSILFSSPN